MQIRKTSMHKLAISKNLDALVVDIGERPVVMLGEASHGTHEFYTWRTAISKRLIQEKGFNFIAVEGDWPDCYKINRYVKGYKDAGDNVRNVLMNFDRWPTWMWANWEVAALAEWLRDYNQQLPADRLLWPDVCVREAATTAVLRRTRDRHAISHARRSGRRSAGEGASRRRQQAAQSVRKAIQCFEPYEENEHVYARYSLTEHSCRDQVIRLLKEVRMKAQFLDGDREAGFNTEQNALIAVNAEKYYRSMIGFDNESWNVRDTHMMETLDRLLKFHGKNAKGNI